MTAKYAVIDLQKRYKNFLRLYSGKRDLRFRYIDSINVIINKGAYSRESVDNAMKNMVIYQNVVLFSLIINAVHNKATAVKVE
jgi:hypothetical protein